MRYHRFFFGIYDAFIAVSVLLVDLALEAFRYGIETAWHSLGAAGIAAYRNIAELKPEYRESYATHGLSLSDGRAG